jgi:Sec-independent protein secretion pathway component TatC
MSDSNGGAAEESFISHLVELRDRIVKAVYGLGLVCLILMVWPGRQLFMISLLSLCWNRYQLVLK